MKPEEDLYFDALKQTDPVIRRALLDQNCSGNPALRARLERLLILQAQADQFFAEAERQSIRIFREAAMSAH